jgi:hypothetical protein
MRTNEILLSLIAVKELQIKTLTERVVWLETINQESANVIQDYQLALASLQEECKRLRFELNRLYALKDSKKTDKEIGFHHEVKK